ncbi:MAG: 4'-phosphopantetheinyl transferase superfamily protein [Bdellovibrionales bacterium]|jgi:phosphopantetheinyl transferase (holo-ACP synthase)|nr:4'-phosphopantetheinyl transferase superfamily protein [Bdellovibrionales bacterium]
MKDGIISLNQYLGETIPNKLISNIKVATNYFISRVALKNVLIQLDRSFSDCQEEQLQIINHLHLINHPEILVSISHTSSFGAAIISTCTNTESIGIDIEHIDRQISPNSHKFFLNSTDSKILYKDLLKSWTIKEAIFKAVSPKILHFQNLIPNNKKFVLTDIWASENQFGIIGSSKVLGNYNIFIQQDIIVSTAYLRAFSAKS